MDYLGEADALGGDVVRRLESAESLATILTAARRFFILVGDEPLAAWLRLETAGLETDQRKADERSPDEKIGALMFGVLRRATDPDKFDLDEALRGRTTGSEFPKRESVLYQSIAEIESFEAPAALEGPSRLDTELVRAWGKVTILHNERRRILNLVRQTAHRLVLERLGIVREQRAMLELFGLDAITVFASGGTRLSELRAAALALGRPGSASSAAQQARTTLLTLGRELYTGPGGEHRSPQTGKTFLIQQEMNKLHAVLDDLWEKAPADRRKLIEEAHAAADVAYDLGSKAKNPAAITHDEARKTVLETYKVAHALCFSGGFPLPVPQALLATPGGEVADAE